MAGLWMTLVVRTTILRESTHAIDEGLDTEYTAAQGGQKEGIASACQKITFTRPDQRSLRW